MRAREDEKDRLSGNLLAVASRANRGGLVFNAAKAAAHPRHTGRGGLGLFRGARVEKVETTLGRLVMRFKMERAPASHFQFATLKSSGYIREGVV